jgi:hypothetical protein
VFPVVVAAHRENRVSWLPLCIDRIPEPLRALGWVGWRARQNDHGEWKKEPFQLGRPSQLASNANPDHWGNEGDVREIQVMAPDLFDGFGVALLGGIVFIDLDHVRDPVTGAIDAWARDVVKTFNSWTEISASGDGLHVFCLGQLPGSGLVNFLDGDPAHKIEVYDRGRFAFLTGHVLERARPLVDRQHLVTMLPDYIRPAGVLPKTPTNTPPDEAPIPLGQRNDQLFRIARSLVKHGLRGRDLDQALLAVSHRRCVPVPPDLDVIKIARHAERLPDRSPR